MWPQKIFFSCLLTVLILLGLLVLINGHQPRSIPVAPPNGTTPRLSVVASNFASYDFLRAIIGDDEQVNLQFLLGPGKDAHTFDPTPQDILAVQQADLFVYIGGTMENWADGILASSDHRPARVLKISDFVTTKPEQEIDDMQPEDEDESEGGFDEHIWTAPDNAIAMIQTLTPEMCTLNPTSCDRYQTNARDYIDQIQTVDQQIQALVTARVRDRLVFADKMPMQYFINYYGLKVSAVFAGCSSESEPTAKTLATLEKRVQIEDIPVVLYLELNPGTLAQTICRDLGTCTPRQIQSLHNISLDDIARGETWVSLMTRNLDVLRAALL